MTKNIFENAYLGKIYKARNGEKCVYLRSFVRNGNYHLMSNGNLEYAVDDAGLVDFHIYRYGCDIISEWQDEISEGD